MNKPFEILVIEDNLSDFVMVQTALRKADVNLENVVDGDKAIDWLTERIPDNLPDLVMLDINMPRVDGFTVLKHIRDTPALSHLVVIILTTSTAKRDVERGVELGMNTYIPKPMSYDKYEMAMETVRAYWQEVSLIFKTGNNA